MASYKRNFVIVIMMVFYSIMNLDNANCPTTREECILMMLDFCGFNVSNALKCAQNAITKYPPNQSITPDFVSDYFSNYVSPFISTTDTISSDTFCETEVFGPEVHRLLLQYTQANAQLSREMELIKNSCKNQLAFLRGLPIQNIIIKDESFTEHAFEKSYLQVFARKIKPNNNVHGERKTPIEFCLTFESAV